MVSWTKLPRAFGIYVLSTTSADHAGAAGAFSVSVVLIYFAPQCTRVTPLLRRPLSLPVATAWELFDSGTGDSMSLTAGDSATPSDTVVYQAALDGYLVIIPVEVADVGAYAVFVEHGTEEVTVALVSAAGAVLVAGAEERIDEDHEDETDGPATARQWANALVASFITSVCR